jgi:hypothetical protein
LLVNIGDDSGAGNNMHFILVENVVLCCNRGVMTKGVSDMGRDVVAEDLEGLSLLAGIMRNGGSK